MTDALALVASYRAGDLEAVRRAASGPDGPDLTRTLVALVGSTLDLLEERRPGSGTALLERYRRALPEAEPSG